MERFLRDIKKHWRYMIYAGQTELKTEIANSYLNWLWRVIEPLGFMKIYTLVFAVLFNSSLEKAPVFIYIGITFWDFFNRMVKASVKCVRNYKAIVSKVYIPKYILLLVKMFVNGFKMMICMALLLILMVIMKIQFTLCMLWIIPVILIFFVFTFGICTFLLHFGVYVEDLSNVANIVLRMIFYLTGIFYDLQSRLTNIMSEQLARMFGNINPIACIITAVRKAAINASIVNVKYLIIWLGVGIILSIGGIALIYKNENNYVKVI